MTWIKTSKQAATTNENEQAAIDELLGKVGSTAVLTSNILCRWNSDKIKKFALHLLGDKCQKCAGKPAEQQTNSDKIASRLETVRAMFVASGTKSIKSAVESLGDCIAQLRLGGEGK